MFRGNNQRTGYFLFNSESECNVSFGDVNGDSVVDILDVITTVNIVLGDVVWNDDADVNGDGVIDILDIISIVNIILF